MESVHKRWLITLYILLLFVFSLPIMNRRRVIHRGIPHSKIVIMMIITI